MENNLDSALTYFKEIAHIYDGSHGIEMQSTLLTLFSGNHWLPVNSIQKGPVMWNFGIFFVVSLQQSVANTHKLFTSCFIVKPGFYLSLHHKPQRMYSCPYAKHDFLLPSYKCIYRHHNGLRSNLLPTHLVVMASAKAVFAVNERYMCTIASSAIAKATQSASTAISQLHREQRHTDWFLLDMDSTQKSPVDVESLLIGYAIWALLEQKWDMPADQVVYWLVHLFTFIHSFIISFLHSSIHFFIYICFVYCWDCDINVSTLLDILSCVIYMIILCQLIL